LVTYIIFSINLVSFKVTLRSYIYIYSIFFAYKCLEILHYIYIYIYTAVAIATMRKIEIFSINLVSLVALRSSGTEIFSINLVSQVTLRSSGTDI